MAANSDCTVRNTITKGLSKQHGVRGKVDRALIRDIQDPAARRRH